MSPLRPRLATIADAETINAIYNHYVRSSTATFQVEDETTEERIEDLQTRPENQPLTVLEVGGEIVAWGALSPFRSRCAYRDTIELTIYVRHDCHRRGYGRVTVQDLIERARSLGYHTIIAASCEESVGSIRLLQSLGFAEPAACARSAQSLAAAWMLSICNSCSPRETVGSEAENACKAVTHWLGWTRRSLVRRPNDADSCDALLLGFRWLDWK